MKKNKKLQKFKAGPFTDDDFFDDCPICQYTKKMQKLGQPETTEGLKEAFEKANKRN